MCEHCESLRELAETYAYQVGTLQATLEGERQKSQTEIARREDKIRRLEAIIAEMEAA